MDIFKLLKTLNSAQSSWQITLAILLGMFSGFLPISTPINFLILFLAFTINVPLAVFFLMTVIFSGLGLLLDPIFASLGYEVLTNSSLNSTFTGMYNYSPTLWSSYNHTIVMGSLIVSTILAIPAFFILNTLIDKYRHVLEAKFKDSKYFSWLNPYSEKKLTKKPGVVRWIGSVTFIVIVGLISAILLFLIDPVIKFALEYSLSKATDKTIYIDSVESKVFDASLGINGISILSDSDMDDISIDKVLVKLNMDHLLEKKFDFEIISFGNVTFATSVERRDEKHITQKTDDLIKSSSDSVSEIKAPELPSVDELIAKEGLKSVQAAKDIQKSITEIQERWTGRVDADKQKEKIASLEVKIKSLAQKAQNVKSPEQIMPILTQANELKKELSSLQNELKTLQSDYQKDSKLVSKYLQEIQTLPMQDYNNLKNKYSLDSNGAMNLLGTHFSSSFEKYLRMGKKYYAYVKPYISKQGKEKTAEEKRMEGQWITYASKSNYPNFVVRKLDAKLIKNENVFDVKIKDVSDNQKLYKKPIIGNVISKSKAYKLINVDFEHNELARNALTKIDSTVKSYALENYAPMSQLSVNDSTIDSTSKISVIDFTSIKANVNVDFIKTHLLYNGSESLTDTTIKSILSDVNSFSVDALIDGSLDKPTISVNSDIDKKIANGLKNQASKEAQKYAKELKVAINKKFQNQLGNIDLGGFNDISKTLSSNTSDSNSLEKTLEKNISKEAMQKKLQGELLKGLGDKVKFF